MRAPKIALAASTLMTLSAPASAATLALTHGKLMTANTAPIDDGTIVIRDGMIVAVGHVPVPRDSRIVDLRGAVVTPGLIAADTALGTVEVNSVDGTNDIRTHAVPLSAGVDVQYSLNGDSTLLPVALLGGVTRAIVLPEIGSSDQGMARLFAGQGAAISLAHGGPILTRAKIGVVLELGEAGAAHAGGSRAADFVLVRSALEEVRRFRANRAAYERGDVQPFTLSRADLEALIPVMERKVPLIVGAHRASDILQAVALATEYRLRLIIRGGEEAWRVAPELARVEASVIVTPTDNLPKSFEMLGATSENAERLVAAGVTVAVIGNDGAHRVREMRLNAGMAVARGLHYQDAIKAMTINPARMFGLDDQLGSIEPGKKADLVVWTGDPLEPLVQPQAIFVAGVEQPLASRARMLAGRYAGVEKP